MIRAKDFAAALDADNYEGIRPLLSSDCTYDTGKGVLVGPDAIITSYRKHGTTAPQHFDKIEYSSEIVDVLPGSATVLFTDRITLRGLAHVYRCKQRLQFGDDGRIVAITHEELPGERQRLLEFCTQLGVNFP